MSCEGMVCYLVKEHMGKGIARSTMFVHFLDESAVETKAATAVVGTPSSSVVCATEDAC